MDEPLRLEYVCTPEELKQAQELNFTAQVGRGSKWRALAVMVVLFGSMGILLFLKLRALPAAVQPYLLLPVVVIIGLLIVAQFFRRKPSAKDGDDELKILVEITSREVRLAGPTGWAIVPWNGFGKLTESETLFLLPDASGYQLLVFPKRVFPDESSRRWFRELAQRSGSTTAPLTESPQAVGLPDEPDGVRVEVLLRLSDYLDRGLASWKTRGFMIFFGVLLMGTFVVAMTKPAPNAVFSKAEVFFYFCLPFLAVLELVIFLTASLHTWLQHRHLLKTQVISLSPAGVSFSQSDSRASTEWTGSALYKETPWSFFLWWPTGVWFQIPKRTFATVGDADRCRRLLAEHAQQTTWYFG